MSGASSYCVLLRDPQARTMPADLAQVMGAVLGAPMQDFLIKARRCFGLVETGLSEEMAQALAQSLKAKGIDALSLPAALLEDLPAAEPCAELALTKERWERTVILGAAAFKQTERKTVKTMEGPDIKQQALKIGIGLATGLPMGFGGGKKEVSKIVETSELVYFMDILLDGPPRRLRIDAQNFNFSCLGPRMGPAAAGNFRRLIEELSQLTPGAWLSRGAHALMASEPLSQLGYDGLEDLERECRWLWTLRHLG